MKSRVRNSAIELRWFLGVVLLFFPQARAWAQAVVSTVTVGARPHAVSVDPVTNKVYVAVCPNFFQASGSVAVIDGATNAITTITAARCPVAVAVNPTTDKIYVADIGTTQGFGYFSGGSVIVIDGATDATTTISDPDAPNAIAVNPVTNKIYAANHDKSNVMIIDGDTNDTTTVADPNATGVRPVALAVNQTTNKIYVANKRLDSSSPPSGNVTVIDGATNTTSTITDPNAFSPVAIAVDPVTNKIYVANQGNYPMANHGNVTVIDGTANSTTTVTDPNALAPQAVAVNQITNKIYVANINDSALTQNGGVTVIDGATNSFSSLKDPNAIAPVALAVDETKNKIYVTNEGGLALSGNDPGSVTIIDGVANSTLTVVDQNAAAPAAVSIDAVTNHIYVANISSNNITVISGATVSSSFSLSVTEAGSGKGTVSSNPSGIDCGSSCTANFAVGTVVVLTASPASGSTFSGWSGACSGTNCSLTMTSNENVTAAFNAGPPPDFSLTPATATLTVQRGGQMTDVITIAPLNGSFNNAVQLTCGVTGSTPPASCSLSSASVTPAASSATTNLTVTAPTQTARLMRAVPKLVGNLYAVFLALPSIALIGIRFPGYKPKLRSRQFWLVCCTFIVLIVLQAGCGGGNSNPPPPLNYTVTVTATSGAIQHATQVSITVP